MLLIIRDQLVNPPTWFSSYRDLTLYYSIFLRGEIVIESEEPDFYVKWLRARGGLDFVEDFIRPGSEDGLRIDCELNYPRTIVTDRITPENLNMLINKIKIFNRI